MTATCRDLTVIYGVRRTSLPNNLKTHHSCTGRSFSATKLIINYLSKLIGKKISNKTNQTPTNGPQHMTPTVMVALFSIDSTVDGVDDRLKNDNFNDV